MPDESAGRSHDRRRIPYRLLSIVASFATIVVLASVAQSNDFVPLVRGTDPGQFDVVGLGPDSLKIQDGAIQLSGKPYGYFAVKEAFHDYVLKFDWRYDRPADLASEAQFEGNSGLLVHLQKPHKVWPKSIQVQLLHPDEGHIFGIFGAEVDGDWLPDEQKRAVKPVGQWNEEEVTCRAGTITCAINGVVVDRSQGAKPDRGQIAWQSEGTPIQFRNLRIKRLD